MALTTKTKFAFIDVETTGLSPSVHEVIELACALVERDETTGKCTILEELDLKLKPEHIETAESVALKINGYDESAWMFAHTQVQAFTLLAEIARGATFVAHNVAFDWGFIESGFRRCGLEPTFDYHKLDTLSIAFAKLYGRSDVDIKHLSLKALCEHFSVKNESAHSAMPDVRATVAIFEKLMLMK